MRLYVIGSVFLCLFCVNSQILTDSGLLKGLVGNTNSRDANQNGNETMDFPISTFEIEKQKILAAIKGIQLPHLFRDAVEATKNLVTGVTVCTLCVAIGKSIIIQRRLGATREQLFDEINLICTALKIEDDRVCSGTLDLNLDIILYVIDNRRDLTAVRFCGIVFQNFGCPLGLLYRDWTVDVPGGKTVAKKQIKKDGESFNVLHVTDIHYDPRYTPGNNADCGEPICCQDDQPPNDDPKKNCGYWSEYRDSDAPWHMIEDALDHSNTHDFKYVYYTGDIISHRVWNTSVESNTESISKIFNQFKKTYKVPVYPCLGNHEPNPLNVFAPDSVKNENFSTHWLYDLSAELWSEWLPESALETIRKGGYYTVTPEPGFRIISLNSNVCYAYNWWLVLDDVDPYGQLKWLVDVLEEAEKAGESVHIVSHVPTGDTTCLKTWSKAYAKIFHRFANTITGQFVGHSHFDEFLVYYDNSLVSSEAVGVAFNGASITTFTKNNPSYKVFKVDKDSYGLLDYEEWTFNVTEANLRPNSSINWFPLYKFTEAYGVDTLDPTEVGDLVERMMSDQQLTQKYFRYKSRHAAPSLEEGCDSECDKQNLCSIVTSVYGENSKCREVRAKYSVAKVPVIGSLTSLT